jgi:predicted small integral membrane protein
MWIFTRYGFFSIACATGADGALDADTVMVRSRLREHLLSLKERFPETELGKAEIQSSDHTDYRYRIVMPKAVWVAALTELATEQTWSNFKNETSRFTRAKKAAYTYVDALHRIWDVMHRLQVQEKRKAEEVYGKR